MPSLDNLFEAWCSQHQVHPDICWDKHNPNVKPDRMPTPDEQREAIRVEHIRLQEEYALDQSKT